MSIVFELYRSVVRHNQSVKKLVYSVKNYKIQVFLHGYYQFSVGFENWMEIICGNLGYLTWNLENFWKIIGGEYTIHFDQEIEKLYCEKLPKYMARHPKTNNFAIKLVIDDYGRDY